MYKNLREKFNLDEYNNVFRVPISLSLILKYVLNLFKIRIFDIIFKKMIFDI